MSFVGDIVGGFIQSDSNRKAANIQADASREAVAEQRRQYDQTRADYSKWRDTGANALTQLAGDINAPTTASDVMSDPGYQFGMDQGTKALNQRIAAAGGRVSGYDAGADRCRLSRCHFHAARRLGRNAGGRRALQECDGAGTGGIARHRDPG